ncbi:MAG: hypothetical protein AABX89_06170 [Candidatus Thermoplasmatota archaeon]
MRASLLGPALVASLLLAGCSSSDFEEAGVETVSAGAILQKALANGLAWNGQARLVAARALEVSGAGNQTQEIEALREKSEEFAALVPGLDDAIGDGKARAWNFEFASPSNRLSFIILPSGDVTFRVEKSGTGAGRDLSNFTIDSDQATNLARLKQESFATLQPNAQAGAILLQTSPDGNRTEWILALSAVLGGKTQSVAVRVDAHSGEVLLEGASGNATKPAPVPLPPQESGTLTGTLAMGASNSQEFTLAKPHGNLSLLLELPNPQVGSQVRVTVTSPGGVTTDLQASVFLPLTVPTDEAILALPPAGTYTVDTTLQTGLSQEFRLSYCTTEPGPSTVAACPAA